MHNNLHYENCIIDKDFYLHSPVEVAQALLGKYLVRKIDDNYMVWKIIETEAYLSTNDLAAHNAPWKTQRNKSLYEIWWNAYVHSMRQYCLLDIVTEEEGVPSSVLIRSIEPIDGIELMMYNRKGNDINDLLNWPGKICQAMSITKDMDGIDMTTPVSWLYIADIDEDISRIVIKTPRIWISKAKELPLRFLLS